MFFVLATLGSLGFAERPKSAVADFVEQGFVHRSLSANKKAPFSGGLFIGGQRGGLAIRRGAPQSAVLDI
jgi:hypothetical protein